MLSMVEYVHERMHTYDNLEIGVDSQWAMAMIQRV